MKSEFNKDEMIKSKGRMKISRKALLSNNSSIILNVQQWEDYNDGEQLQIKFIDGTGIFTSFINTTLIDEKTDRIKKVIVKVFSGDLENTKWLTKIYK